MCGIIHCKTKKLAKRIIRKRFMKQKARGTEGFGYVEIKKGIVQAPVRSVTEKEILSKLKDSTADEILFHHRIPTSTPNFIESTHPIKVSNPKLRYDYYVIHNGIISNDKELYAEHKKLGFDYTTEIRKEWITTGKTYFEMAYNDSECLAVDFALSVENKTEMKSEGSIAIIALQYDKKSHKAVNLLWGRNTGSPLCEEVSKDMLCLSSESGQTIPVDILYSMEYKTGKITSENKNIGDYAYSYSSWDYNGYIRSDVDMPESRKKYLEESDYFIDKYEEIDYLTDKIKEAERIADYDKVMELESELYELQLEVQEAEYALSK